MYSEKPVPKAYHFYVTFVCFSKKSSMCLYAYISIYIGTSFSSSFRPIPVRPFMPFMTQMRQNSIRGMFVLRKRRTIKLAIDQSTAGILRFVRRVHKSFGARLLMAALKNTVQTRIRRRGRTVHFADARRLPGPCSSVCGRRGSCGREAEPNFGRLEHPCGCG